MNLAKKKQLAAKVLKVGINRIKFDGDRLPEIKEAITKQDIKDLHKDGFITIKEVKGRKKIVKRKTRRGPGKIKKKIKKRKQTYVKLTRKLRNYLKQLKNQGKINNELYWELRKRIRMKAYKSKANLKEYLINVERIDLNKKATIVNAKPKKTAKKTSEKKDDKEIKKAEQKERKSTKKTDKKKVQKATKPTKKKTKEKTKK